MSKKFLFRILFTVTFLAMCALPGLLSVPTASAQAVLPTPTAQEDGRIIYIAQAGDSWWIISVKTGVSENQLYELNNAKPDDPVLEGQKILIGVVTATEIPTLMTATATPNILTPAVKGYGEICVKLFEDVNGNSNPDPGEAMLGNGAISLVDRTGQVNKTGQTTTGPDPVCFSELPEGDYNLSVAVPDGYNPTTSMNAPLHLVAGDKSTMNFGAQSNSQAATTTTTPSGGQNKMIAVIGGVLIVVGIGLGLFFLRSKR
jgi:hypothetical protein